MARSTSLSRAVPLTFRGSEYLVVSRELRPQAALTRLTRSEAEVLQELLSGQSYTQIAASRGRSRGTVANQVASILRKLGIGSQRELWLTCGGGLGTAQR
jgi:DNA-binding CsgD family transcriptional regulator